MSSIILVLQTIGPEFRVKPMESIDLLDEPLDELTAPSKEELRICNARKIMGNCKVYHDPKAALAKANELLETIGNTQTNIEKYTLKVYF